jgi:hypothetical protein
MEQELIVFPDQIWRKEMAYDWLRVDRIQDPRYEGYDGGMIGCSVTLFPPQLHGIQCRGGKRRFIAGEDWEKEVMENRFLLQNWHRGDKL